MELPFNFYSALFVLLMFSSCIEQWVLKFNTWKERIKNGIKISRFFFLLSSSYDLYLQNISYKSYIQDYLLISIRDKFVKLDQDCYLILLYKICNYSSLEILKNSEKDQKSIIFFHLPLQRYILVFPNEIIAQRQIIKFMIHISPPPFSPLFNIHLPYKNLISNYPPFELFTLQNFTYFLNN